MTRPGIEPGPTAYKARTLPLGHGCGSRSSKGVTDAKLGVKCGGVKLKGGGSPVRYSQRLFLVTGSVLPLRDAPRDEAKIPHARGDQPVRDQEPHETRGHTCTKVICIFLMIVYISFAFNYLIIML